MTEAYTSLDNEIRFYTNGVVNGSQIPFNFELISFINSESTAHDYKFRINSWLSLMPEGYQANWVVSTAIHEHSVPAVIFECPLRWEIMTISDWPPGLVLKELT